MMAQVPHCITRLAPSPTGALHLGNARTFLINWALARQRGWQIVLRIEDLDVQRVRPDADAEAIDDLRWLGADWDVGPLYQRADLSPYREALGALRAAGMIYPCACSRREIALAQSAPHAEDGAPRYPGTCRRRAQVSGDVAQQDRPLKRPAKQEIAVAWRLAVPEGPIEFVDRIHGPQCFDVQADVGDFVVATKEGLPAYQLAVVVDDARQGVTDVVRGDDLLPSTARQLWLYRTLGTAMNTAAQSAIDRRGLTQKDDGDGGGFVSPAYWHVPLVLGTDGRRMAKRHYAPRLAVLRERGVPAERVIGLLARWCGLRPVNEPMSVAEFLAGFVTDRLQREPVTLTPEDEAWLLRAKWR